MAKQEDIHLRLPGTKYVNFELLGTNLFGVKCNFALAGDIADPLRIRWDAEFDSNLRLWLFNDLENYNEVFEYLKGRLEPKNVEVLPIPKFVFDLMETPIAPNQNPNYKGPNLHNLPTALQRQLYNF